MKLKFKEIFLKAILGSIFHCLISPSHGMEENDQDKKQRLTNTSVKIDGLNSAMKNLLEKGESLKRQSQDFQANMEKFDDILRINRQEMLESSVKFQKAMGKYKEKQELIKKFRIEQRKIYSFTFENRGLTDKNAPEIAKILSKANFFTTISFSKNKFSSISLQHILPVLALYPNLETLDFASNLIDNSGGKELTSFVEEKISLKVIDLYGNPINEEIQRTIRKTLSLRINPEDIRDFTFGCCGLTDADAPQVANLLSQANHLIECILSDNKFTSQSLMYILPALHSHPSLEALVLQENLIDDTGGKELLDFMKEKDSLKLICLSGNNVSKSIKKSIKKIGSLRSTSADIESYTLRNCGFTDENAPKLAELLSQATSLTEVNLGKNKLTSESLKHILPALEFYSDLELLNFESNLIDDNGVKELLIFLETKPSLKKIYIGGNNLTNDAEKIHEKFDMQKEKYNSSTWGQACQLF